MTDGSSEAKDLGYSPAPYPDNEEQRQSVVSRLFSHQFDLSALDPLVAEVASAFDVPMAAATVLDCDWQRLASKIGLTTDRTSRAVAFCGYTISHETPFLVPDAQQDARFAGNPLVLGDPSIRFYAGARIVVDGMPVGALCAIGQTPRSDVDQATIDRLEALAATASQILNKQLNGV